MCSLPSAASPCSWVGEIFGYFGFPCTAAGLPPPNPPAPALLIEFRRALVLFCQARFLHFVHWKFPVEMEEFWQP
ncbi:hypothetical protein SLEP1_g35266 [Rubroshorea leprosula]|uniref:Uncharacterized protein n=1 Tax=Rubroshorea leprosula TaxID=152421 RepID=A0AAV5KMN5_9ROSI|nr:hypothetical protein SLEP1_g35266 [Rubroshorea leprosula]